MLLCICIAVAYRVLITNSSGKKKQHSRRYRIYQSRNKVDDRHAKQQYQPSTITDDDERLFEECRTKAAEVRLYRLFQFTVTMLEKIQNRHSDRNINTVRSI